MKNKAWIVVGIVADTIEVLYKGFDGDKAMKVAKEARGKHEKVQATKNGRSHWDWKGRVTAPTTARKVAKKTAK